MGLASLAWNFFVIKGNFVLFFDQHCLICLPLDSNVSADAGIEPRTVATLALAVRRFNLSDIDLIHLARPYPGILYLQTVQHVPERLLKGVKMIHLQADYIHMKYKSRIFVYSKSAGQKAYC